MGRWLPVVLFSLFLLVLFSGCTEQEEKEFWDELMKNAAKDILTGKAQISIGDSDSGSNPKSECRYDPDCPPSWCVANTYNWYNCIEGKCVKRADASPCAAGTQCVPGRACVPVKDGKLSCVAPMDCGEVSCEGNQLVKFDCVNGTCKTIREAPCPDGFTCHPVNGCVPDILETCKDNKDCPRPTCGGPDGSSNFYYNCFNGTCVQSSYERCSQYRQICITGVVGCQQPGTQRCIRDEDCKAFKSPGCTNESTLAYTESCNLQSGICRTQDVVSCYNQGKRCVEGQGCV